MHLPLVNQFCWMRFADIPMSGAQRQRVYTHMRTHGRSMRELFALSSTEFAAHFPTQDRAAWHCPIRYAYCKAALQRRRIMERLFPINSDHYPDLLRRRLGDGAPPMLYQRGRVHLLRDRQVAVIGRRDIRYEMRDLAEAVGSTLATAGYTVAVGYDTGIAERAAAGALAADGTVCAYPASGLAGVVWRQSLRRFGWQRDHCLVSAFSPDQPSSEAAAAARNRIMVANSTAVVLLEAAPDRRASGRQYLNSVGAAQWAVDLDIPLFVLHPAAMPYRMPGNRDWLRRGSAGFRRMEELVGLL